MHTSVKAKPRFRNEVCPLQSLGSLPPAAELLGHLALNVALGGDEGFNLDAQPQTGYFALLFLL